MNTVLDRSLESKYCHIQDRVRIYSLNDVRTHGIRLAPIAFSCKPDLDVSRLQAKDNVVCCEEIASIINRECGTSQTPPYICFEARYLFNHCNRWEDFGYSSHVHVCTGYYEMSCEVVESIFRYEIQNIWL